MLEKQKKRGLIYAIAGAVLLIVGLVTSLGEYQSGVVCGVGTGLIVLGVAKMIQMARIGRNEDRAADYEASFSDERNVQLAGKAAIMAMRIAVLAELAAGLFCAFALGKPLINQVLCYAACFQCILYFVIYRIYNKKY